MAGVTLGIAIAFEVWSFLEVTINAREELSLPYQYLSAFIINVTMAFCLMLTTFVADELAANRPRAWPLYAVAVVLGAATGALLQWELHQWLALPPRTDIDSDPGDVATAQRAFLFIEYLIWGGIIVWIYVSRRAQTRAEARMTAAQLQRAETQRRTIRTRLQTLQAQVEPQFLQKTLARVCDRYEVDSAEGSEMLGRLIVYLRAALPQLRESASTLAREVELVRAYVDVIRLPRDSDVPLDADVPEDLTAARMPPMVLLPLISQVLLHRNSGTAGFPAIRISAKRVESMLRLEITAEPACLDANDEVGELAVVRERVRALYGSNGRIAFERAPRDGVRAIIEIPHETADGNHR